jgi:antitoxin component of MazEF toxin-antitoxin module
MLGPVRVHAWRLDLTGRLSRSHEAVRSLNEVGFMSTIIKADASGAVTLPAELCRDAGVEPGTDLVAEVANGRIVLERPRRPIWERIAEMVADVPPEELAKLPTDGASQHDHYIYGTPKRPDLYSTPQRPE